MLASILAASLLACRHALHAASCAVHATQSAYHDPACPACAQVRVGLCGDEAGRAARRSHVAARLRQRLQVQQRGLGRAARLQRPARRLDGHAVLLTGAARGATALVTDAGAPAAPGRPQRRARALSAGGCGRRGTREQAPLLPPGLCGRCPCRACSRARRAALRSGRRRAGSAVERATCRPLLSQAGSRGVAEQAACGRSRQVPHRDKSRLGRTGIGRRLSRTVHGIGHGFEFGAACCRPVAGMLACDGAWLQLRPRVTRMRRTCLQLPYVNE